MKKHINKILLPVILISLGYGASFNPANLIKRNVNLYFQQKFEVAEDNLRINYLRLPQEVLKSGRNLHVEVYSQRQQVRLGYQTVWVKLIRSDKLLKKFPVSVDVSLQKEICVAKQKIKFHSKITADMLKMEKRLIREDYDKLISGMDKIIGMEAKQVIGAGRIITADLLRQAPLIHRNQKIRIKIMAGGLLISMDGIARGEGTEGQMISVRCTATGKLFKARIQGPGDVLVTQEYAL